MRIATSHCVYISGEAGCMYLINMQDFPDLYREFCKCTTMSEDISTASVEEEGSALLVSLKNSLDDAKHTNKEIITDINDFVRNILKWGGKSGNRRRGHLYPESHSEEEETKNEAAIAEVVVKTAEILLSSDLDLNSALSSITSFDEIGDSYGSKILRMLLPRHAGAYDEKILKNNFPSYIKSGYAEFCADCQKVADDLKKLDIKSHRENGEWYVADVEAVIYHYCRYYKKT